MLIFHAVLPLTLALLTSFCVNYNLHDAHQHCLSNIDYTYNFNMIRFSTLDHFILSDILIDTVVKSVSVSHDVSNLSDHDPIKLTLQLDTTRFGVNDVAMSRLDRPSWVKATNKHLSDYRTRLGIMLDNIVIPTEANRVS